MELTSASAHYVWTPWKLDSICIQSNSRLRVDRSIVLEPVVVRVVASHEMAQPQEVGWLHNQRASG